ncbi:hypothetical protein ACU4GH_05445 [Bradyrhizobium betae]
MAEPQPLPPAWIGAIGCSACTTGAGAGAGAVPASSVVRRLRPEIETQELDRQLRDASTWNRWPPIEKA